MNVVSMNGGKVHTAMSGMDDHPTPLCRGGGMNQMLTKFRTINAPLTCKTCMTYAERRAERIAREAATTDQGEIMAENTEVETTIEQINANIERAQSLAEAENTEGLAELNKETEALISSLPQRGKAPSGETWTKTKQKMRNDFRAVAEVQTKPEPKGKAVAKAKPAEPAIDPKDYSVYQGVTELIADGAERVAEGVRLHRKVSDLAKDTAAVILDMWRRIPNKDGNPDIMGNSQAARNAAAAIYAKAGEGFELDFDNAQALAKLQRSVQSHRSDVRAQYLRELENDAEEQKRYAKALEAKPEGVTVSEFIADLYGTQLKGHGELNRERYQQRKELGDPNPLRELEADTTPDERVQSFVKRVRTDFVKATPEDFEAASDETKQAVRDQLMELRDAVNDMIKATL
jgi:hypothetical protein